jgi:hypothetical protein
MPPPGKSFNGSCDWHGARLIEHASIDGVVLHASPSDRVHG